MAQPTQTSHRLLITGGRVIDPANRVDAVQDLCISDGRVVALGKAPDGFSADQTLAADGQIVCPGLIDISARLREPGDEHKATITSETRAAAASGITTLCCPPDTSPVIDTTAVVELVRQCAEHAGHARVVTLGALTRGLQGKVLSEMAALRGAGCVGISNARKPMENSLVLRRAMEYAATFDLTVFLNPEDHALADNGCAHEGAVATRLGLPAIPEAAETAAVARDLALIEQTGVRAHFCRLSTARAIQMVGRAQYDGLPVTADVAAHQLFLTENDIADFDSMCHVSPPLRTLRDRDGLRAGLVRGIAAAICSDHQPHEPDVKQRPFTETAPGISGLETLLPLTMKLVEEGVIALTDALARVTCGPARCLGMDSGTLSPGSRADLCLFTTGQPWRLDRRRMLSRGRNTPFDGWEFDTRVIATVLAGKIVYQAEPLG